MKTACILWALLASISLLAVTGNSANSVTVTIGQSPVNGGELYIAWSGQFAGWPSNVGSLSQGTNSPRFVVNGNEVYAFATGLMDYFDGSGTGWTVNWPTFPTIAEVTPGITVVTSSELGFISGGRLFVPQGYTPGNALAGCISVPGRTIDAFTEYTGHVVYSWDYLGTTQELILNVFKTEQTQCTLTAPPNPGSGGDPHFHTWAGRKYDFHGHCDLVLLNNKEFANGKGISIHIRSDPFRDIYSYISRVALQIGDDVFELGPRGEFFLNGKLGDKDHSDIGSIGGSPVDYRPPPKKGLSREYTILLDKYTRLKIREKQGWHRVSIHGANAATFGNSTGLMGSFGTGTWYGRDGVTVFDDVNDYGVEWQVKEDLDGHLFQSPSPFPDKCEVLTKDDAVVEQRGRRLSESSVSRDKAKEECLKWVAEEDVEDCIFDVLVADDVEIAELGA